MLATIQFLLFFARKVEYHTLFSKKICDACPEIDYKWLLTGLGEMLNNIEVDNSTTNKIAKDIASLKNHILELEIKIKKLEKELKSFYDAIE